MRSDRLEHHRLSYVVCAFAVAAACFIGVSALTAALAGAVAAGATAGGAAGYVAGHPAGEVPARHEMQPARPADDDDDH